MNNEVRIAEINFKVRAHLMFALADVIDTLVGECEKYLPPNATIQKKVKEQFKKLKHRTEKTVRFVDKNVSFENAVDFGDDADYLHEFILTLVDRVGDDKELETKAISMIKAMKSQVGLKI